MALGDIVRLAVVGEGGAGQELVNVYHYRQESFALLTSPTEDLISAWRANVEAAYLACFSSNALLDHYNARGVTNPTEGFDFFIPEPRPVGGISGDALPPQVSAVVTWRTGLIGRSFRGRTYVWPAGESSQNNGIISSGYQSALQDFADAAVTIPVGLLTGSWQMVIHSETAATDTPVTDGLVRSLLNQQRRRKAGVGA